MLRHEKLTTPSIFESAHPGEVMIRVHQPRHDTPNPRLSTKVLLLLWAAEPAWSIEVHTVNRILTDWPT